MNDCVLSAIRSGTVISRKQNEMFDDQPILGVPKHSQVVWFVELIDDAQAVQDKVRKYWDPLYKENKKRKRSKYEEDDGVVADDNESEAEEDLALGEEGKGNDEASLVFLEILQAHLSAIHPNLVHASYGEFGVEDLGGLRFAAAAGLEINTKELLAAEKTFDDGNEAGRAMEALQKQYKRLLGASESTKLAERRRAFLKKFEDNKTAWQSDKLYRAAYKIYQTILSHREAADKMPTTQQKKEYLADHKALAFCEYLSALDLLEIGLKTFGIAVSRFDGTCSQEARDRACWAFEEKQYDPHADGVQDDRYKEKDFSKDEVEPSDITVMLVTNKTGAEGITLIHASDVFIIAPTWNPHIERQLVCRAVRTGCTRPVQVHKFLAENSIEMKVRDSQFEKMQMGNLMLSDEFVAKHAPAMRKWSDKKWEKMVR